MSFAKKYNTVLIDREIPHQRYWDSVMRLSGLQKEVLSLYRKCLREARKKPEETRGNFRSFARAEFEKSNDLDKKDFSAVEYLLRKGQRQLELYSEPGIKNIH